MQNSVAFSSKTITIAFSDQVPRHALSQVLEKMKSSFLRCDFPFVIFVTLKSLKCLHLDSKSVKIMSSSPGHLGEGNGIADRSLQFPKLEQKSKMGQCPNCGDGSGWDNLDEHPPTTRSISAGSA